MAFERVFAGSKLEPSFYDVYDVETVLDPAVMYDHEILSKFPKTKLTNAVLVQARDR